ARLARRAAGARAGDHRRALHAQPGDQSRLAQRVCALARLRRPAHRRPPDTSTAAFDGLDQWRTRPSRLRKARRGMSTIATRDSNQASDKVDAQAVPTPSNAHFVSPHERRDGFWASIRGHVLDLADPGSGQALAPTPDDLFIVSIASELAWTARTILRAHGAARRRERLGALADERGSCACRKLDPGPGIRAERRKRRRP